MPRKADADFKARYRKVKTPDGRENLLARVRPSAAGQAMKPQQAVAALRHLLDVAEVAA